MKKVLKVLACSLVISMLLNCVAFAKPVHTSLFPDSYAYKWDTAANFVLLVNAGIQQKNIDLPFISDLNLIDNGSDSENTYLGSWGSSTVIIKEDAETEKIKYISISLPSSYYTEEGTIEGCYYFGELGLVCGIIYGSNDNISDAEIKAAYKQLKDGFNSKTSCSCSAGKLHYEWLFGDNVMVMNYTAIVDDGTK
ncbi:MAG: hypothetical protein VB119_11535 [Candidatus Metalachnospira sp.]|nr:hypothetical protein [Candidatus Metalachnospira sp.]